MVKGARDVGRPSTNLPGYMANGFDDVIEEHHAGTCQDANGTRQQQNLQLRFRCSTA